MEYFQQHFWEITAIVVAVLIAIISFNYQRRANRKRLSYYIAFRGEIINNDKQIDGLKLFYKDHEVENLYVLRIEVVNNGGKEISKEDFITDLKFTIGKELQIFNLEIVEESPSNLGLEMGYYDNVITVSPLLLNPKDSFVFQVLTSRITELYINTDVRIKGVRKIGKPSTIYDRTVSLPIPLGIWTIMWLPTLFVEIEDSSKSMGAKIIFGIFLLFFILSLLNIIWLKKSDEI